ATQVTSRIRGALGVELPLRALFEAPRVEALCRLIETATRDSAPPLVRQTRGATGPLSFGQQRLWFLQRLETDSAAYNIPSTVRLRGELDSRALERAISGVVRGHEVLRTTFIADAEGTPFSVIHPAADLALEVVELET